MDSSFSSPTTSGEVKISSEVDVPSARQDVGIFVCSVLSDSNPNRGVNSIYTNWPVVVKITAALEKIVQECGASGSRPQSDQVNSIHRTINLLSEPAKAALTHFIEELHHKLQDGRSQ